MLLYILVRVRVHCKEPTLETSFFCFCYFSFFFFVFFFGFLIHTAANMVVYVSSTYASMAFFDSLFSFL